MVENGSVNMNGNNTAIAAHVSPSTQNGHRDGPVEGKAIVVVGAQWGDEGKGKLVDLLVASKKGMNVCRCQGGNNAGHTVVVGDVEFDFHILPCGILNENSTSILGNGVVIHVGQLFEEIAKNEEKGMAKNWENRLIISDRAHLVLDIHQFVDGRQEAKKSATSIGTTKKGIGPAYSSKANRIGLRIADLVGDFSAFRRKFGALVETYKQKYPDLMKNYGDVSEDASDDEKWKQMEKRLEKELEKYEILAAKIRPCVKETVSFIHATLKAGNPLLVEGANATMLDIDFGTYPYVTSSNCTAGGVCTGLGIPPMNIGDVYGVAKAYCTRVGSGPFPTEQDNEIGKKLQSLGREIGVTTKRIRRCGWLDTFLLRYSNMLNGYAALAITKLDILDDFDEIKIGCGYIIDGVEVDTPPANSDLLYPEHCTVKYLTFPGWKTSVSKCRTFESLPKEAQDYILAIERLVGVKVKWIGVGAERESIITRF